MSGPGERLKTLFLQSRGVLAGGKKMVGRRRGRLQAKHPAIGIGLAVDQPGIGGKGGVGCNDLTPHGRVDVGGRLDALHGGDDVAGIHLFSGFGKVDKNHIAQFGLGVIGHPHGGVVFFHPDPFVTLGVAKIVGSVHRFCRNW